MRTTLKRDALKYRESANENSEVIWWHEAHLKGLKPHEVY